MYVVKNLPALMALTVSVVLSIIGIYKGNDLKEVSIKIAMGITAFYMVGYALRAILYSFLQKVLEESERKAKILKEIEREESKTSGRMHDEPEDDEFDPYMPTERYESNNSSLTSR